jgi:hypothetical protein
MLTALNDLKYTDMETVMKKGMTILTPMCALRRWEW